MRHVTHAYRWQLSRGCRWLKKLSLSWCTLLTDVSFAQVLRKRALHFRRRALCIQKRVLYLHKRALCFHKEPDISGKVVSLLVHTPHRPHFCTGSPQNSPTFPQKSPISLSKIPIFPQKSPMFPQRALHHRNSCLSPGALSSKTLVLHRFSAKEPYISVKRALYLRKRALDFRQRALLLSLSWCTLLMDVSFA